ncbi:hypothetical protein FQA39_LY00444 [Lamprigera yunnana]|nr:hypothetical protein FQA39_LY00444 [Lamprigera yunnana]
MKAENVGTVKYGGHRFENGTIYVGYWNDSGQKHSMGHELYSDGSRYDGLYKDGFFNGLGILIFADGAKYEGEFLQGWFHGNGVFWRADGMRYEGEFRGGKVWGLGLTTFKDETNGFPRYEGFFKECKLIKKVRCPEAVQKAQKVAFTARTQFTTTSM